MFNFMIDWYNRNFSDPRAIALAMFMLLTVLVFYFAGDVLTPLFIALVVAYLLEWPVSKMVALGIYRWAAASIVLIIAAMTVILFSISVIPSMLSQAISFVKELPSMFNKTQDWLKTLPEQYPDFIDVDLIQTLLDTSKSKIVESGNEMVAGTLGSLGGIASKGVYGILITVLVFFMLKDKDKLLSGLRGFLPDNRELISSISSKMNLQIANYVRGKIIEIIIVGFVSYGTFYFLGINYALLLSVLVGFSVLIPFVGAAAVTVPIALVGVFQWGFTAPLFYVLFAYAIIQLLDGNVLSPLLLAEAVNIHPIAIIVSVMVFGGLWGLLGVFFAIPLATLIEAIISSWPRSHIVVSESKNKDE